MSSQGSLRLLIVDDHDVVRSGLRTVLDDEEGIVIVGEARDADGAVTRAFALRPDIVLMDIRMGEGDDSSGIDACRRIRSELNETQVIMFTSFGERESVLAAILAGATGFLTKNVGHGKLLEAIRAVGRGESILDPRVTREVMDRLSQLSGASPRADDALSDREKQVLALVTRGYTNKEIAAELTVSPFTARNHVTRILEKLGVSRRSEAAAEAVRLGIVTDGDEV